MGILRITDVNESIKVDYIVDLLPNTDGFGNCTIMEIKGLSDAEKELGLPFIQDVKHTTELATFAEEHDLKLVYFDSQQTTSPIVIRDFTGIYYMDGLGIDNI